jgi:hypothetical protein
MGSITVIYHLRNSATLLYKPGHKCPASGIYAEIDANGTVTGYRKQMEEGEKFPPTPGPGMGYVLAAATGLPRAA